MSPFQIIILEIIKATDGKFSWYQLDRSLTHRAGGLDPAVVSKDLMPALRELEQAGFITTSAGHNPGQPSYAITPKGRERLKIDREETGTRNEVGPEEIGVSTAAGTGTTAMPA